MIEILDGASVSAVYERKAAALTELASVFEDLIDLKNKRAVELALKVETGLYADCKNEDQRKAAAAFVFQATDAIIKGKEKQERECKLALELVNNEIAMIETLVKLAS